MPSVSRPIPLVKTFPSSEPPVYRELGDFIKWQKRHKTVVLNTVYDKGDPSGSIICLLD